VGFLFCFEQTCFFVSLTTYFVVVSQGKQLTQFLGGVIYHTKSLQQSVSTSKPIFNYNIWSHKFISKYSKFMVCYNILHIFKKKKSKKRNQTVCFGFEFTNGIYGVFPCRKSNRACPLPNICQMTAKIVYDACLRLSNIHILEYIVQLYMKRFLWNERSQLRTSHSWLLDWLIYLFIGWCLTPNEQYFSYIHYKNKSTNNKLLRQNVPFEWFIACMLHFPCNGPRATTPKRLLFIRSCCKLTFMSRSQKRYMQEAFHIVLSIGSVLYFICSVQPEDAPLGWTMSSSGEGQCPAAEKLCFMDYLGKYNTSEAQCKRYICSRKARTTRTSTNDRVHNRWYTQ